MQRNKLEKYCQIHRYSTVDMLYSITNSVPSSDSGFVILTYTGYLIPKGWCVLASFISVHMDEENYENPYLFEPWRWEVSFKN